MEGLYYPYSENKGADQLRGYHEADLRLCFRICKKSGFLMTRLILLFNSISINLFLNMIIILKLLIRDIVKTKLIHSVAGEGGI